MNIDRAHLVGLLLGALAISDFITVHPERVKSAVLADGALTFDLQPAIRRKIWKVTKKIGKNQCDKVRLAIHLFWCYWLTIGGCGRLLTTNR